MWVSGSTSSRFRGEHLFDDLRADDRLERVTDRSGPGRHLLGLGAGEEPELLTADREQRAEDEHPLVRALLEHSFEAGREGEHALPGACIAAEADDADARIRE